MNSGGNSSGMPGRRARGVTLIEVLITISFVGITWTVVDAIFRGGFLGLANARARTVGVAIANEKLEIIRNLPYDSVGTTGGWPTGGIPSTQTVQQSNFSFTVFQRIDYVDDPFDGNLLGTIPGKPVDTSPNDYKRAEVTVSWDQSPTIQAKLTTLVAPRNVEAAANTGSFVIGVVNASGVGVPQATVRIQNTDLDPDIDITNTTDNFGNLQVIGLPPSVGSYKFTVSKSGYSTEQTYSTAQYPNPFRPNLTIVANQVTQTTFAIDQVSSLAISTQGENCAPIGNIPLSIYGDKLIATGPDVLKYSSSPPTDATGKLNLTNLEWDDYTLIETSSSYNVSGVIPPVQLNILPNTAQSTALVLAPSTTNNLHVTVKNATDKTTVTAANVRLTRSGYDQAQQTGVGYFSQTDWSGGAGQATYTNKTRYFSDDGNVDVGTTTGSVQLEAASATGAFAESFSTTTQRDPAPVTTADWNTSSGRLQLPRIGSNYVASAVGQSIKLNTQTGRITRATLTASANTNGQTIRYYLSVDGGATFEQVTPGSPYTFTTVGSDLRFRVYLATNNSSVTPTVDSLFINATFVTYAAAGNVTSSTLDTGGTTTDGRAVTWEPSAQVPNVGPNAVRIQVAGNTDNATWDYVGPDGTAATYFTEPGTELPAGLDGKRYYRYRLFLQTADTQFTPIVSSVAVGYTSGCIPPGQAFFSGLSAGSYSLDVTAAGFTSYSSPITVSGPTDQEVLLTPT